MTNKTERPVGRPKKKENESYSERITILLTKEEKIEIEKNSKKTGLSGNKYLRKKIFKKRYKNES